MASGPGPPLLWPHFRTCIPTPIYSFSYRVRGVHRYPRKGTHGNGECCTHGGDVSSLLYATPPPSRSGPKAPKGGGLVLGGGGLAAEEGLPRGLASRC